MIVVAKSGTIAGEHCWQGVKLNRAMIGVAVVAVALTFGRMSARVVLDRIDTGLPFLAMATVALVAARLWPPHPPLERLLKQPGFLACGTASVMLVGAAAGSLALSIVGKVVYGSSAWGLFQSLFRSLGDWGYLVGLSVMVSWVVLGAVRGWRAEPTAADRVGRAIGWAWVVLAPAGVALRLTIILGALVG